MTTATRRHITGLLALVAALFLALGPALAPVLSTSAHNKDGIEICTAFGLVKVALEGNYASPDNQTPGEKHTAKNNHCVFCNLRQLALLPDPPTLPAPPSTSQRIALKKTDAPTGLQPVHCYQSRAPPLPA